MTTEMSTAARLEAAKERLRAALTKLENTVEMKVNDARKQTGRVVNPENEEKLRQQLELFANENKQLKAENEQFAILQGKLANRVDKLIEEVKQVVGK